MQIVCPQCEAINRLPDERARRDWSVAKCAKCGLELIPGTPLAVNGAQFRRHIDKSDVPVLVDFWADWCGPCHAMAPAFSAIALENAATMRFLKIDTDANPHISGAFGIRSIPTLILFRQGKEAARQSGAMTQTQLRQWIASHS